MPHREEHRPKRCILVVDDLPSSREFLATLLSEVGYEVRLAASGEEALVDVVRHPPDLILLDVLMPGMSGTDVLRELKGDEETRLIPVILLSVQSAVSDRIDGLEHGADDYIGKPFNHQELVAKISTLLKIRDLNEQLRQAEKLTVLAQAAVSVNHQVNNPLSSILYAVDILEMTLADSANPVAAQIQVIRDSVEQIRAVMKKLSGATEVVPVQYLRDIQMLDL